MTQSWYRYDPRRALLTIALYVQPNARRTQVDGLHGDCLKIRVAAPASDGKANEALASFLADKFDLPGAQVMIRRGRHGRTKTVEIYGRERSLLARVKELLHS